MSDPEKGNERGGKTDEHEAHHGHHGRRLKQFLRPDGRTAHVAMSPDEVEGLKRHLSSTMSPEEFDVYIHGSPEHLEALRQVHEHHQQRQNDLRERNIDVYEEFARVRSELDALSAELHMLTDHGVSLNANFSKYGYNARLRTRDDPESSGTSMLSQNPSHEDPDWAGERNNARSIKFFKKPVVRQYFHKGLIWRASETTEVASFELFVDLLYVGIIAINGDTAAEHPDSQGLLRFAITFILSWKLWSDLALIVSWIETDDVIQRLSVLFTMTCLFGFTTNITEYPETTYSQMIAFYLAARLFACIYFMVLAFLLPLIRAAMIQNAVAVLIPSALWIASTHVEEPRRQGLIWVAIALGTTPSLPIWDQKAYVVSDLFGAVFMLSLRRILQGLSFTPQRWNDKLEALFEFYPAVNIEHRTERTNAFVTLVFGYSVVSILYQNKASVGINAYFGKAILGLIQAFTFNWLYFEIDGYNLFTHAIRRHFFSATIWLSIHLPFIMSFVLAAGALSRLVLAHDCPDANLEDLAETSAIKSEEEVSMGLRWFYCGGISIALASMGR
ncbi:MAG: hypothetical protein M4579_002576 [Chaenotheca gracillima]|nr:MAG: hypothetical protein M4579_002576 [Chaenotheca gracillima]